MRFLAIALPILLLAACAESEPSAPAGPAPLPAHPVGQVSTGELPPVHASGEQASRDCGSQGCKTAN